MTDFLTELRGEVLDAHAAHAKQRPKRRVALRRWPPPQAVLGAAAVAAAVFAVVLAVRWLEPPPPAGPRVLHTIQIGGLPLKGVVHGDSLWIADHQRSQVLRIDPRARRVRAEVPLPGTPSAIAAERGGGLWVRTAHRGDDETTLSRLDPATNRIVGTADVGPDFPLAVAGGAAWAAVWSTDDNVPPEGLYRIDGATGAARRLGLKSVGELAAADGAVWALTTPGELVRIDAASGRIAQRFPQLVPAAGATAGGHAIVADADGAWVLSTPVSGEGSLVRVEGDRIVRRLAVRPDTLPVLAATGAGVWLATADEPHGRYALLRIDASDGRVTATVDIGGHRPNALLPAGDALWVVGGDGTLVVVGS